MCLYAHMTVSRRDSSNVQLDWQTINFTDSVTKTSKSSHLMIQQEVEGGENKQLRRSMRSPKSMRGEFTRNTWIVQQDLQRKSRWSHDCLTLVVWGWREEGGWGRNPLQEKQNDRCADRQLFYRKKVTEKPGTIRVWNREKAERCVWGQWGVQVRPFHLN